MSEYETSDTVERASPLPFDATLKRLTEAITGAGMTIFAQIDHAANARDAGLAMPPATVLIYGAAKGGRRSCLPRRSRRSICRCGC